MSAKRSRRRIIIRITLQNIFVSRYIAAPAAMRVKPDAVTVAIREKIYNLLLEVIDASVLPSLVDCLILPRKRHLRIQRTYMSVMGAKIMRQINVYKRLRFRSGTETEKGIYEVYAQRRGVTKLSLVQVFATYYTPDELQLLISASSSDAVFERRFRETQPGGGRRPSPGLRYGATR